MTAQIERIEQKLAELRRLDPQGSVLFGAATHQYKLGEPATEALLKRFESKHQVRLPEEYRTFLLRLGNGGAGPYYGLYKLEMPKLAWLKSKPVTERVQVAPFSSAIEYSARHWEHLTEEVTEADEAFYAGLQEKALEICTLGCELQTFLLLEGPRRGQVWTWDAGMARNLRMGFWPETLCDVDEQVRTIKEATVEWTFASVITEWNEVSVHNINPFGDPESEEFFESLPDDGPFFLDWYEHWLDAGLRYFQLKST